MKIKFFKVADSMSSAIYDRNIKIIAEMDTSLAEVIDNIRISDEYECTASKNGLPNVKIRRAGKEHWCHSPYAPDSEAAKYIEQFYNERVSEVEKARLGIIVGFGMGYYARELIRRFDWFREIIIIEPAPVLFKIALTSIDMSDMFRAKKINLVIGELNRLKVKQLDASGSLYYAQGIIIPHPQVTKVLFPDIVQKSVQLITEYIEEKDSLSATLGLKSKDVIRNNFYNLVHLFDKPLINEMYGRLADLPIVCIASGPSLTDYLEDLKLVREKAIFIAADSAFNVLMEHGIKPDIVTALEPRFCNKFGFIEKNAHLTKDILLVTTMDTYSGINKCWQGPIRLVVNGSLNHTMNTILDHLVEKGTEVLTGIPTVGMLSLKLADRLGGDPIVMVGQDLRFTEVTHAAGSANCRNIEIVSENGEDHIKVIQQKKKKDIVYDNKRIIYIPDYDDNLVRTIPVFDGFRKSIELFVRNTRKKFFNITATGAKIAGVPRTTFAEITGCFDPFVRVEHILSGQGTMTLHNREYVVAMLDRLTKDSQLLEERINAQLKHFRTIIRQPIANKDSFIQNMITSLNREFPELMAMLNLYIHKEINNYITVQYTDSSDTIAGTKSRYVLSLKTIVALRRGLVGLRSLIIEANRDF
ncbi:MAG TPA: hypothetical protein DCS13_05085 [Candidatus Margulisbacteria bacterium]|nr:hypothetical protein [Candidatus Margulisiibacteriota bacterium]